MREGLKKSGRLDLTVFLAALSVFCMLLTASRILLTGSTRYLFLMWNLILAFIPWLLTSLLALRKVRSRLAIILIMAVWLLFFPNSLYILTDLIHLRRTDGSVWLDFITLLSFAWAGLCYGFISLMDFELFLKERFRARPKTVTAFSIGMIFLAAFGIYLGRFLRWNSWDVFGNPAGLFNDIFDHFTITADNLRSWGFTFLMGMLLNFMYFPLRYLSSKSTAAMKERSDAATERPDPRTGRPGDEVIGRSRRPPR